MIYEVRTYTLRPGTLAEFEERYEKRLPSRLRHSPLGGFWHTEFGPLNQVVHVYPYDDLQHRTRVRAAMANDAERNAIPGGGEFIAAQEAEIVIPAPFMRALGSRDYGTGNVYEMRTYTYAPGDIPKVLEAWGKAIEARERFSPLAACWTSELGGLNKFVHTWVYKDLNERARVREESRRPGGGDLIAAMESEIMNPAPFMRPLGSRDYGTGNVYEMRTYTYAPGDIPKVLEAWAKAVPAREELSLLAACWTSELGGLSKFVHTWVYKDLGERARIREESRKPGGAWPPQSGVRPVRQENKLLIATAFSPVR